MRARVCARVRARARARALDAERANRWGAGDLGGERCSEYSIDLTPLVQATIAACAYAVPEVDSSKSSVRPSSFSRRDCTVVQY